MISAGNALRLNRTPAGYATLSDGFGHFVDRLNSEDMEQSYIPHDFFISE
jgi:hypothetical protein